MAEAEAVPEGFEALLRSIARAVRAGPNAPEWKFLEARTLPELETKNWTIARPVQLLKRAAPSRQFFVGTHVPTLSRWGGKEAFQT